MFVLISPNGKAVQTWTFADKKHIIYCNSPEWAMKLEDEKSANRRKNYLKKHFPNQQLNVIKLTIETTFKIG